MVSTHLNPDRIHSPNLGATRAQIAEPDDGEQCRHTYPRIAINQSGVHFSNWPVGPHAELIVYTWNLIIGDYDCSRNVMILVSSRSPSAHTAPRSLAIVFLWKAIGRSLQESFWIFIQKIFYFPLRSPFRRFEWNECIKIHESVLLLIFIRFIGISVKYTSLLANNLDICESTPKRNFYFLNFTWH